MARLATRYKDCEVDLMEVSMDTPYRCIIRGVFREGEKAFYKLETLDGDIYDLPCDNVLWIKPVKNAKQREFRVVQLQCGKEAKKKPRKTQSKKLNLN